MDELKITSPSFKSGDFIPRKYTCRGEDVNPLIEISGIPGNAQSLALIVDDPDAPMGTWVHWVMWNIPVSKQINENSVPGEEGWNDFKRKEWGGPCPPSGTHRYYFKVYALDDVLDLPSDSTKEELVKAMEGHILAKGELMGRYKKG